MFRSKKKWQVLVDKLYPADVNAGINSHQVSNLLHYARITQDKLPNIGKYLEKRAREDVRKNRVSFVGIAMKAFRSLLSECGDNLALFSKNMVNVLAVLFDDPRVELRCMAADTFVEFANSIQEIGAQQHELDRFVGNLYAMVMFDHDDASTLKHVRVSGLKALRMYIVCKEDIDGFIARWLTSDPESEKNLLDAMLKNIRMKFEENLENRDFTDMDLTEIDLDDLRGQLSMDWDDETCTVSNVATLCLADLVTRLNNISIRPILTSFLRCIDLAKLWIPKDFAMHCVRTISKGLPQQRHLVQMSLLRHVGSVSHTAEEKRSIIQTMVILMEDVMGPVIEIMSSLLGLLIESARSAERASAEEAELQQAILECIKFATKDVDTTQRLDAMTYILHRFAEIDGEDAEGAKRGAGDDTASEVSDASDDEEKGVNDETVLVLRLLAESIRAVAALLSPLPDSRTFPATLMAKVIEVAAHSDPDVRVTMLHVLQHILYDAGWLDRAKRSIELRESMLLSSSSTATLHSLYGAPGTGFEVLSRLRSVMLMNVRRHNVGPMGVALVHTIAMMMIRGLGVYDLRQSISYVFSAQAIAARVSKSAAAAVKSHAACVNASVAGLLLCISSTFECSDLRKYSQSVLEKRGEKDEKCSYLDVNDDGSVTVVRDTYGSSPDAIVSELFDREQTAHMLAKSPMLEGHDEIGASLSEDQHDASETTQTKKKSKRREHRRRHKGAGRITTNPESDCSVTAEDVRSALYTETSCASPAVEHRDISFESALGAPGHALGDVEDLCGALVSPHHDPAGEGTHKPRSNVLSDRVSVSLSNMLCADASEEEYLADLSPLSTLKLQFPSHAFAV